MGRHLPQPPPCQCHPGSSASSGRHRQHPRQQLSPQGQASPCRPVRCPFENQGELTDSRTFLLGIFIPIILGISSAILTLIITYTRCSDILYSAAKTTTRAPSRYRR